MRDHPCMTCGACCAYFRVWFQSFEKNPESFNVPENLTIKLQNNASAMKGTNKKDPRCIALIGTIGESVACSIYEHRPSCCRNFVASFENGRVNVRCDEARISKGLLPLTQNDWQGLNGFREDTPTVLCDRTID